MQDHNNANHTSEISAELLEGDDAEREQQQQHSKSYARPTAHRHPLRPVAPSFSIERFQSEVLGGRLWYPACREAAKDEFTGEIPLEFNSVDDYISTFDPLVIEEAREVFKTAWAENCTAGRVYGIEIINVEQLSDGWATVRCVLVGGGDGAPNPTHKQTNDFFQLFQANTGVVLSLGKPPSPPSLEKKGFNSGGGGGGAVDWAVNLVSWVGDAQKEEEGNGEKREEGNTRDTPSTSTSKMVAGIVKRFPSSNSSAAATASSATRELIIKIHPNCTMHAHTTETETAACCHVLHSLRQHRSGWWIAPAAMLVTSEREYNALHAVRQIDPELMQTMLKPKLLAEIGQIYENPVRFVFVVLSLYVVLTLVLESITRVCLCTGNKTGYVASRSQFQALCGEFEKNVRLQAAGSDRNGGNEHLWRHPMPHPRH